MPIVIRGRWKRYQILFSIFPETFLKLFGILNMLVMIRIHKNYVKAFGQHGFCLEGGWGIFILITFYYWEVETLSDCIFDFPQNFSEAFWYPEHVGDD